MGEPSGNSGEAKAQASDMRAFARGIFLHALNECSISRAFARHIRRDGSTLLIGDAAYNLKAFSRTVVISIGKAGHTMASALTDIVALPLSGIIACPTPPDGKLPNFQYFIGGHPLPNEESLRAGSAMLELLKPLGADVLTIFLISGGASAIAETPILQDLTLDDVVATYRALVHSGAPIAEINAIRKHLSALKGGRLAQAAAPATQVSVLVSDVPDDALDALASGPTLPDSTTAEDCYAIAARCGLLQKLPPKVRRLLEDRLLTETPRAGDASFRRSSYTTVLSNEIARDATAEEAAQQGFTVVIDNTCDDQDYRVAADYLLQRLRELHTCSGRVCLISGGEVTVKVAGNSGVGGRNQQFALYCAKKIAGENITVLSAGTDGIDGNSKAAGAVVDGRTIARASERNLDVAGALSGFDAFPLFEALGDTVLTGPTGNNVRDLRILLSY